MTAPDPIEAARCMAHGDEKCAYCTRNPCGPGGCDDYYRETGMHWDTCPNRIIGPLVDEKPDPIEAAAHAMHAVDCGCRDYGHPNERGGDEDTHYLAMARAAAGILIAAGREAAARAVEDIEDDENRGFCRGGYECGCGISPDYVARVIRGGAS